MNDSIQTASIRLSGSPVPLFCLHIRQRDSIGSEEALMRRNTAEFQKYEREA